MQRLPYHMLWQPRELCRAAAAERPQNLRFYPAGLSHRMRRGDWPHETSITFSQMARTAHRLWRLALLGFCFCGGILLGQLAARSVPEASRTELAAYLRQYAAVWGETTDRTASLLRVAGVYLRYPLLVTVLGFCGAAGAALILPVLAAEGFFLSFSAGCFAAALGRSGVLLALAAFGVRCLIVLPCSIYPAMLVGERNRWRKLAVCGALLLLGMALELTLVPRLVQWALGTLS